MRRRFSLEKLFFFLSRSEDFVHITEPTDENFLKDLSVHGFSFGSSWLEGDFLPEDANLVEWGRRHDLNESYLIENSEKIEISSYLNSKLTQRQWKEDLGLSELRSKLISSEEQLLDYLSDLIHPVVLKSEYGLAGRNHIILENQSQGWKLQQIAKKLFRYPIYAEDWVGKERYLDFSTLWDFTSTSPVYLGSTEMMVDKDGSFRGIRISAEKEKQLTWILPNCLETMKSVFSASEYRPTGPAAMDGFFYRKDTSVGTQVFSEINFRYSMGRVLYEIRKKRNVKMDESGILFLPLNKMKPFNEVAWLVSLREQTGASIFFVTPIRDAKGKFFQNVGIYYEVNDKSMPAEELVEWLTQQWRMKIED
ncbi:hypothetical protein EHQ58_15095 [Leptospira ognonensis]|uniref:ATP-grasp domain-containing protein n=1 Tax=Leptospira ognonensis TaxID=2484945 RepID=A0A4R9JVV2_9LEPT|nr:hypothetical protein [Leptospira ognonensis]TGL57114.1 hypothetical protein EHQ58_15095 [Leptospira ognonensis]